MTFAESMAAALLTAGDPLTYVDGFFTITVSGYSAEPDILRVASCVGMRDDVQVFSDDLLLVNPPDSGDALAAAQTFIAQMVRERT
jgi:hypothetical protein